MRIEKESVKKNVLPFGQTMSDGHAPRTVCDNKRNV
jgi:hypothetical protein